MQRQYFDSGEYNMNRAQGQRPPVGVPALAAAHRLPSSTQPPIEAEPLSPPQESASVPAPVFVGAPGSPPSPIEEHATGSVSPTPNPTTPPAASKDAEEEGEAEDSMGLPPMPPVLAATGAPPLPPELADQPIAERRNRPASMLLAARGGGTFLNY